MRRLTESTIRGALVQAATRYLQNSADLTGPRSMVWSNRMT